MQLKDFLDDRNKYAKQTKRLYDALIDLLGIKYILSDDTLISIGELVTYFMDNIEDKNITKKPKFYEYVYLLVDNFVDDIFEADDYVDTSPTVTESRVDTITSIFIREGDKYNEKIN